MFSKIFIPPTQMVSDAEKSKESWQHDCINAFESLILFENKQIKTSYYNKVNNYNLKRGILNMADVEYVLDPYQVGLGSFPARMDHKGIGNSKIDLLVGEQMNRRMDFRVVRSTSDQQGIRTKEENKLNQLIKTFTEEIQSTATDEQDLNRKLQDIYSYINTPFFDVAERGANKLLKYLIKNYRIKELSSDAFEDALIVAEEYAFIECLNEDLIIRKGDPTKIFTLMNAYSTTEAGLEALVELSYNTISSIVDIFYSKLKSEDLKKLETWRGYYNSGSPLPVYPQYGHIGELAIPSDSLTAQAMPLLPLSDMETNQLSTYFDARGNIRVLYCIWKSKRQVKVIKFINELGLEDSKIVHDKYQINEDLGEEIKDTIWINEWWRGYKIGPDIFVGTEPFPYLSTSLNNISRQQPPVIIQIHNTNSSKAQSLMDIIKPYDYLYDIFSYKREHLINLMLPDIINFPVTQIPDNMTLEEYLNYVTTTAFMPTDPSASIITPKGEQAAGIFNTNNPGRLSSTQAGGISILNEILQDVIRTMDIVSGITQQRQGAIENRETVGGVERSVQQSSHTTERWFNKHDRFMQRLLKSALDMFIGILRENPKKLAYLTDDFTSQVITDEEFEEVMLSEMDVFISNSSDDYITWQKIEQKVEAAVASGNADIGDWASIIKNESAQDALRILKQRADQRRQQQEKLAEESNQMIAQKQQQDYELKSRELDIKQQQVDNDKYEIELNAQIKLRTEAMKSLGMDEGSSQEDILKLAELDLKSKDLNLKILSEKNKSALEMSKMQHEKDENAKDRELTTNQMENDLQIERIRSKNKSKAK